MFNTSFSWCARNFKKNWPNFLISISRKLCKVWWCHKIILKIIQVRFDALFYKLKLKLGFLAVKLYGTIVSNKFCVRFLHQFWGTIITCNLKTGQLNLKTISKTASNFKNYFLRLIQRGISQSLSCIYRLWSIKRGNDFPQEFTFVWFRVFTTSLKAPAAAAK